MWDAGKTLELHSESFKELRQSDNDTLGAVQVLAIQNQQLRDELRHERELRQTEVAALRRELSQVQENLELRFRLELSKPCANCRQKKKSSPRPCLFSKNQRDAKFIAGLNLLISVSWRVAIHRPQIERRTSRGNAEPSPPRFAPPRPRNTPRVRRTTCDAEANPARKRPLFAAFSSGFALYTANHADFSDER